MSHTESDTLPDSGTPDPRWAGRGSRTDAELIERSRREPERFAEVFDRYYVAIHGYVSRRLGSSSLADDVASETFLIAFHRRERYEMAHPNARPWLYGIASNLVARHHRGEVRRYRALARAGAGEAVDGHSEGVAVRLAAEALRSRLAAALVGIADRDREVLLLVAWAGRSCEEAAALLARATRSAPSGRPSTGRRVRLAAVGAFAVAIALALLVVANLGGLRQGRARRGVLHPQPPPARERRSTRPGGRDLPRDEAGPGGHGRDRRRPG